MFAMFRLVSQLEERVKTVSEEISSLEGVDRRLEELQDKMSRLARQLGGLRVWDQDHANTEDKLVVRLALVINTLSSLSCRCVWYSQSVPFGSLHYFDILKMISIPKIPILMHRESWERCKHCSDSESEPHLT